MKTLTLGALLGALMALHGSVQAADAAALYQEKTCHACHGVKGNKPLMPDYPRIAGQNARYVERQMLDIKNGVRTNGNSAAMQGVMHLVSDEEIKVLAAYVASLKP